MTGDWRSSFLIREAQVQRLEQFFQQTEGRRVLEIWLNAMLVQQDLEVGEYLLSHRNSSRIFERMYQIVVDGNRQAPATWASSATAQTQMTYESLTKAPEDIETFTQDSCVICFDDFDKPTVVPCRHVFCFECIVSWANMSARCPSCRQDTESRRA